MTTYQQDIDSLPYGIDKAVLRVLSQRKGIEKAVTIAQIQSYLSEFKVDARQIRLVVSKLRKAGWLIGSGDKGYWMIANRKEWEEVRLKKFTSAIQDMWETVSILDSKAREQFGDGYQDSLFNA